MSTATLSRSEVLRLRERKRPRTARPWSPIQPRGRGLWDGTLAKARELATPDGLLNLRELGRALKISDHAVRARRATIVQHWGAAAWPWVSPRGYPARLNPGLKATETTPLVSDPPPEGWQERAGAIRAKAIEAKRKGKRAPGINLPATKDRHRTRYAHAPDKDPWRGPHAAPQTGDALRRACRALVREWRAQRGARTVYGVTDRERDLAAREARRNAAGRSEEGWGNRAAV